MAIKIGTGISLKKALVLSLLVHVIILALLPAILIKQNLTDFSQQLLTVDFQRTITEKTASLSIEAEGRTFNASIVPKYASSIKALENEQTTSSMQRPQSDQAQNRWCENNISSSALTAIPLGLPRKPFIDKAKLLPPVKAMSLTHQKFLINKVNEFADKLFQTNLVESSFVLHQGDQTFWVTMQQERAEGPTNVDRVNFTITYQENDQTLSTEITMQQMAFSNYAHFVDYWDPQVAIHHDEISGRFHSNTAFNISRRSGIVPKFYGKVTTSSYSIKADHTHLFLDDEKIFCGGVERGVEVIRLPKNLFPFLHDAKIDSSQIHFLSEESWLTFNKDGSYFWQTKAQPEKSQQRIISQDQPAFILGNKKAKLHVKGNLKGRMLVYSKGQIIIDGHLVYACPPEDILRCHDYLGLVSELDIQIAPLSITGAGDLFINAAIFAKGRFCVANIYEGSGAVLHIFGSLSAGSVSATEPRFATKIFFDQRLKHYRPPYFPMTDHFEIVAWDRQWRIRESTL